MLLPVTKRTALDLRKTYVIPVEKLKEENMMNPSKIVKFIEENELGYILGNATRAIIYSRDPESRLEKQIQHLKDARQFLNIEIKKLSKKQEKEKIK